MRKERKQNSSLGDLEQATSLKSDLVFSYDAMGNRLSKLEKPRTGTGLSPQSEWKKTVYVRDATGNVMATYKRRYLNSSDTLSNFHIFGSDRLGVQQVDTDNPDAQNPEQSRRLGDKRYELKNHLGNVLATISDLKRATGTANNVHYEASMTSYSDYFPFGFSMTGRKFNQGDAKYGFNGMENDNELKGDGNFLNTYYRQYDSRIVRWTAIDPKSSKFPYESPYVLNHNSPMIFSDPKGDDPITGIAEALTSFGVSVGMDFLSSYVLEGKSYRESYESIAWGSAALDAGLTYAIATVTPPGTATGVKLAKLANTKVGKLTANIVKTMIVTATAKYENGDYHDGDNFALENIDVSELFWDAVLSELFNAGFSKQANKILDDLEKTEATLYRQLKKFHRRATLKNGKLKPEKGDLNKVNQTYDKMKDLSKEYFIESAKSEGKKALTKQAISKYSEYSNSPTGDSGETKSILDLDLLAPDLSNKVDNTRYETSVINQ